MAIRTEALSGQAMTRVLADLARLRIEVFRDFPYLYDGTPEYEAGYLERLASSRNAVIVGAFDADEVVGCATAMPLEEEHGQFLDPVRAHGIAPESTFYLAESVLRPAWRGQGIGLALLQQSFATFFARGITKIKLNVDSGSLTNAPRLYEKAGMKTVQTYHIFSKTII